MIFIIIISLKLFYSANCESGIQLDGVNSEEPCHLFIKTRNPMQHLISGLIVVSESRTLEISNETSGYLMTERGKKISLPDGQSEGTSLIENKALFLCTVLLKEANPSLCIKVRDFLIV